MSIRNPVSEWSFLSLTDFPFLTYNHYFLNLFLINACMPTVLRVGPYRFFFYAGDGEEAMHIHIERDNKTAKFWLDPIRLQSSGGFNRREIGQVHKIIDQHYLQLTEAWHEYFDK